MKKVGVLALQGGFAEHVEKLRECGAEAVEVRSVRELEAVDALIIPGGESTTLSLLMATEGLDKEIVRRARQGMPVWGTCAGAILLAKKVAGNSVESLKLMDFAVERNAYGRQGDSFEGEVELAGRKVPGVFIRAPAIARVSGRAETLASLAGEPVAVRQRHLMATTFHPELADGHAFHRFFLGLVPGGARQKKP